MSYYYSLYKWLQKLLLSHRQHWSFLKVTLEKCQLEMGLPDRQQQDIYKSIIVVGYPPLKCPCWWFTGNLVCLWLKTGLPLTGWGGWITSRTPPQLIRGSLVFINKIAALSATILFQEDYPAAKTQRCILYVTDITYSLTQCWRWG